MEPVKNWLNEMALRIAALTKHATIGMAANVPKPARKWMPQQLKDLKLKKLRDDGVELELPRKKNSATNEEKIEKKGTEQGARAKSIAEAKAASAKREEVPEVVEAKAAENAKVKAVRASRGESDDKDAEKGARTLDKKKKDRKKKRKKEVAGTDVDRTNPHARFLYFFRDSLKI